MWMSKQDFQKMVADANAMHADQFQGRRFAEGVVFKLEVENARLRSDLDWFKLRLNAVEKERAQLISAAIGVKIAIPEFQPTSTAAEEAGALGEMPDFSTIGGDAAEANGRPARPVEIGALGTEKEVDYANMPGFRSRG